MAQNLYPKPSKKDLPALVGCRCEQKHSQKKVDPKRYVLEEKRIKTNDGLKILFFFFFFFFRERWG